jgi:hypothetical protein
VSVSSLDSLQIHLIHIKGVLALALAICRGVLTSSWDSAVVWVVGAIQILRLRLFCLATILWNNEQTGYRQQTYPVEESSGGLPLSPFRLILASPHTWSSCWMSAQELCATGCHHTSQALALLEGQQRSQVPCKIRRLCANRLLVLRWNCQHYDKASLRFWYLYHWPGKVLALWNTKDHYCVHDSPPLDTILSHLNPLNSFIPYFLKINANS